MQLNSTHLATVGNPSQLTDLLKGEFLKGHREPRIAMVGRSNVGKSSLINALLEFRLAQTSATPGKTRLIHFYLWPAAKKIVADLPGYGYARAAKTERTRWEQFIEAYLSQDKGLEAAVVLLDARHGPTEIDRMAIEFLSSHHIPVTVVFAKADTLSTQKERALRLKEAGKALSELGIPESEVFWVSSREKTGLKELSRHFRKTE